MAQQAEDYLEGDAPSEQIWFKRCKYFLVLPMARYLGNEEPTQPDNRVLRFQGLFGSWCRNRLRLYKNRNTHLWYSWLQGKRCAEVLSDELIEATYAAHYQALTSVDPLSPSQAEELIVTTPGFTALLELLSDRVYEHVCSDYVYCGIQDPISLLRPSSTLYAASCSASFEKTRAQGGGSAEIFEQAYCEDQPSQMEGTELFRMDYRFNLDACHREVIERRGHWRAIDLEQSRSRPSLSHFCYLKYDVDLDSFEISPLKEFIQPGWFDTVCESSMLEGRATIQAVQEPLKLRVISKGNSLDYYRSKSLQKAYHTALRSIPCFELIGRELEDSDVERIRSMRTEIDTHAISGDYQAATDAVSSNLGLAIQRYLVGRLPNADKLLADLVLGPHDLCYPPTKSDPAVCQWRGHGDGPYDAKQVVGRQKNGQLMGSPLSFPILCLINLLVYLRTNPHLSIGEAIQRVLINGDNILYFGDPGRWALHKQVGLSVGLRMSSGKAYIHPRYANINSMSFDIPLDPSRPVKRVGFLNTGLLYGKHKVQIAPEADTEHEFIPIHSVIDEILEGCYTVQMQNRILRMILRLYSDDIKAHTAFEIRKYSKYIRTRIPFGPDRPSFFSKENCDLSLDDDWDVFAGFWDAEQRKSDVEYEVCTRCVRTVAYRNLFLPISLGGMGCKAPDGFLFGTTVPQKALAVNLTATIRHSHGPFRALAGEEEEDDDVTTARNWPMRVQEPWTIAGLLIDERPSIDCTDLEGVRASYRELGIYQGGFRLVSTCSDAVRLC